MTIPGGVAAAPTIHPTMAPLNPDFVDYMKKKTSGIQVQSVTRDGHPLGGLVPPPFILPESNTKRVKAATTPATTPATPLPATYDLRALGRVTPIRDQGNCGVCWDFAVFASLESCLMPGEPMDFSENNLKNLSGFDRGCCDSGTENIAMAYFARWAGPVNESDDPYNISNCTSPFGLPVQKHVQQVIKLPYRTDPLDNDALKQAVMDYGAVASSMRYDDSCYNYATFSYYYSGESQSNHGISIVGWDDNYPATKFLSRPPGDGAFIVRNTWGADWGQSGYFYMSYYDTLLGSYGNRVFLAEPADNYDHIYQYDELGWTFTVAFDSTNTAWFANAFTATSSDLLAAVSFYTVYPNTAYEIYAYLDPVSGPINPAGPAARKIGTLADRGYNTVRFDTPAPLAIGQKFSVVVKLTADNQNNQAYMPVENSWPPGYASAATA